MLISVKIQVLKNRPIFSFQHSTAYLIVVHQYNWIQISRVRVHMMIKSLLTTFILSVLITLADTIQSQRFSVVKTIYTVSNKGISLSLPTNFDDPTIAIYQLLRDQIYITQLFNENQITIYRMNESEIKFLQWTQDGLLQVNDHSAKLYDPKNDYAVVFEAIFEHNTSQVLALSLAKVEPYRMAASFSNSIDIYEKDNLISWVQLKGETKGLSSLGYSGEYMYYVDISDADPSVKEIKIIKVGNDSVIKKLPISQDLDAIIQIPDKEKNLMLTHSPKEGIKIIDSFEYLNANFKDTDICNILTFLDKETLLCSLYNGSVFVWKIDYEDLISSQCIEQIVIKDSNIERIIYVTANNDRFAVYTEQFSIFVLEWGGSSTSVAIYVVIVAIILIVIAGIVFGVIYMKKKRSQGLEFDDGSVEKKFKESDEYDYIRK